MQISSLIDRKQTNQKQKHRHRGLTAIFSPMEGMNVVYRILRVSYSMMVATAIFALTKRVTGSFRQVCLEGSDWIDKQGSPGREPLVLMTGCSFYSLGKDQVSSLRVLPAQRCG